MDTKDIVAVLDQVDGDKARFVAKMRLESNGFLKQVCRNNKMTVSGNKENLVERLFTGAQMKKRKRDDEQKAVAERVVRQRVDDFKIGDLVDAPVTGYQNVWAVGKLVYPSYEHKDFWNIKILDWPEGTCANAIPARLGTHTNSTFGVTTHLAYQQHARVVRYNNNPLVDMFVGGLWRPFYREETYCMPKDRCLTAVDLVKEQDMGLSPFTIAAFGTFAVPLAKVKTDHLSPEFNCSGCRQFMYLPHALVDDHGTSCGHLHCRDCLHRGDQCSVCRAPVRFFTVIVDRTCHLQIVSQIVACPEAKCEWKGEIGKLDHHWNKECRERKIPCYYCTQAVSADEFAQHVTQDCKERTWTCKKCNETNLKPGSHKECPEDDVVCEFGAIGCPCPAIRRRDLPWHMENTAAFHASWTLKRLKAEGGANKPGSVAMQEGS